MIKKMYPSKGVYNLKKSNGALSGLYASLVQKVTLTRHVKFRKLVEFDIGTVFAKMW